MQCQLLDVGQHEKCVFYFAILNQLLEVLVLKHVFIDLLLGG